MPRAPERVKRKCTSMRISKSTLFCSPSTQSRDMSPITSTNKSGMTIMNSSLRNRSTPMNSSASLETSFSLSKTPSLNNQSIPISELISLRTWSPLDRKWYLKSSQELTPMIPSLKSQTHSMKSTRTVKMHHVSSCKSCSRMKAHPS